MYALSKALGVCTIESFKRTMCLELKYQDSFAIHRCSPLPVAFVIVESAVRKVTHLIGPLPSGRCPRAVVAIMTPRITVAPGQRFGRLVVLIEQRMLPGPWHIRNNKPGPRAALCRCDCGNELLVRLVTLNNGSSKSCGCARQEAITGHRHSRHPLYFTWTNMLARTSNQNHEHYADYGGRGITVHTDWLKADVFCQWIDANLGPRPDGHTLDRIDNDGNYEPGNVRWADGSTQRKNSRRSEEHINSHVAMMRAAK